MDELFDSGDGLEAQSHHREEARGLGFEALEPKPEEPLLNWPRPTIYAYIYI